MSLSDKEHEKLVQKFIKTKQVNPGRCDQEVYESGKPLCGISGPRMWTIEAWVKEVAKRAKTKVDWSFTGGKAGVFYVGDHVVYERVLEACRETVSAFEEASLWLVEEAKNAEQGSGKWAYPVQWLSTPPW